MADVAAAALVDEVHVEFAPILVGRFETPSLFGSPDLAPGEPPTTLELVELDGVLRGTDPGRRVTSRTRRRTWSSRSSSVVSTRTRSR